MKIFRGIAPDLFTASVVTMGMFDGVHLGHQGLLRGCRAFADEYALPAVALTYEPHPSRVLRPDHATALLTTLPEKLALLEKAQIDAVVIPRFTREFSALDAPTFLRDVLVATLHPKVVVVGYRTTFGHARAGTADVLREYASELGFLAEIVEPIDVAGGPVSSTRIRESLLAGDVQLAATLLGYPYQFTGQVVHGDGRGQSLGIATANIQVTEEKLLPGDGVYAVRVTLNAQQYPAVMNIGARPTFARPPALEVHVLDFDGDLYSHTLTITMVQRLRDIRPFDTSAALRVQIDEDITRARVIFAA